MSLYDYRCRCREKALIPQKKKRVLKKRKPSQGRTVFYPNESSMKTFEIKYDGKLSSIAKVLLNSLQNKYLYYAIDDILYSLKDQTVERNNLLTILY